MSGMESSKKKNKNTPSQTIFDSANAKKHKSNSKDEEIIIPSSSSIYVHKQVVGNPLSCLKPNFMSDIVVISNQGTQHPAHRVIVSLSSPIFYAMLKNTEDKAADKSGRLVISDMDDFSVKIMINWMYSGELLSELDTEKQDGFDFKSCSSLYKESHKYQMDSLKDLVRDKILEDYSESNTALELFMMGKIYDDEKLLDEAKILIKSNKEIVFGNDYLTKKFMNDYPDYVCQLLQL